MPDEGLARKAPSEYQTVLKDPNADEQHVFGSPDKLLKKRQGLWIPWYLERKDYDYLHVLLRLVFVPVANVVNLISNPVSFAIITMLAHCSRLVARRRVYIPR
jgi:hypothetical protein